MKRIKIFLTLFSLVVFCNLKSAEEWSIISAKSLSYLKDSMSDFLNKMDKVTLGDISCSIKRIAAGFKHIKTNQKIAIVGLLISIRTLIKLILTFRDYINVKNGNVEYYVDDEKNLRICKRKCETDDTMWVQPPRVHLHFEEKYLESIKKNCLKLILPLFVLFTNSYKLINSNTDQINKIFGIGGLAAAIVSIWLSLKSRSVDLKQNEELINKIADEEGPLSRQSKRDELRCFNKDINSASFNRIVISTLGAIVSCCLLKRS